MRRPGCSEEVGGGARSPDGEGSRSRDGGLRFRRDAGQGRKGTGDRPGGGRRQGPGHGSGDPGASAGSAGSVAGRGGKVARAGPPHTTEATYHQERACRRPQRRGSELRHRVDVGDFEGAAGSARSPSAPPGSTPRTLARGPFAPRRDPRSGKKFVTLRVLHRLRAPRGKTKSSERRPFSYSQPVLTSPLSFPSVPLTSPSQLRLPLPSDLVPSRHSCFSPLLSRSSTSPVLNAPGSGQILEHPTGGPCDRNWTERTRRGGLRGFRCQVPGTSNGPSMCTGGVSDSGTKC